MKILFVGVFGPESTNNSQVQAFERQGHVVYAYDYRNPESGRKGDAIFDEVAGLRHSFHPDMVLFSKCRDFPTWVLEDYEGIPKVLWYMDPVNGNYTDRLVELMKLSDLVYCNIWEAVERSRELGIPAELLQEGFDRMVDRPFPIEEDKDVTFIGDTRGERRKYQKAVGFEVITGVYGEDHARAVCRSRINLNFTEGGSSDRSYKVMAAGGFLLTQPWPHMEDDFTVGLDLDVFTTIDELQEQIERYWDISRRRAVAWHGNRTVQKFTRDNWASRIADDVLGVS